jgi:cell division protein FtsQ
LKRINYRKILVIFIWSASIAGLATSLAFVSKKESNSAVKNLEINIYGNEEDPFLDNADITDYITAQNIQIVGNSANAINNSLLEKCLNAHPAIKKVEIAKDINSNFKIDIWQRKPLVRIINSNDESYYIDSDLKLMPLSDNYTPRVLIVTGYLNEPFSSRYEFTIPQIKKHELLSKISLLDDIMDVSNHIISDSVLSSLIHQININVDNEIELFPAIGNHKIIFGHAEHIADKFNKLKLFYTQGLNKTNGWNNYSTVNLKYKNLVVCTKK